MQLIADSGSTKTTWCLTKEGKILNSYSTTGFNPHYLSPEQITQQVGLQLLPYLDCAATEVKSVFFYGAGISTIDGIVTLEKALGSCFTNAVLEVSHDLLGAARALCGRKAGIACILGTGSNSCYYDGKDVVDNIDALGFILGDEGGGANLGRLLIKSYYYRDLPQELRVLFDQKYGLTKAVLFDNVFKKPMPNRYIANFSRFCGENRSHPFIQNLIQVNFNDFIGRQITKYPIARRLPIHFIGSIAFTFQEELKKTLNKHHLTLGNCIKEPMEGLCTFHN